MLILLLIRRLSPRSRTITGAVLLALGAAVIGVSVALSINLYVHGAVLMVIGAVMWASVIPGKRYARAARPGANGQPTLAGSSSACDVRCGKYRAGNCSPVASPIPVGTMEVMARRAVR